MAQEQPEHFTTPVACSCPDYKFRQVARGEECKHIRELGDALALVRKHVKRWESISVSVDLEAWVSGEVKPRPRRSMRLRGE